MLSVISQFIRIAIRRHEQYKAKYLQTIVIGISQIILYPLLWYFITDSGKKTLLSWDLNSLVTLSIIATIANSFMHAIGLNRVWDWYYTEGKIKLTNILTKPINHLIYIYGINLNLEGILEFLLTLTIFLLYIYYQQINISLEFMISAVLGVATLINTFNILFSLYISHYKEARFITSLVNPFLKYTNLPLTETSGILRFTLTFIIPVIFIAAVPASIIELKDPSQIYTEVIVFLVTYIASYGSWKYAMKKFDAMGG